MGDANASIPTPEPMLMRPMFGARGRAIGRTSLAFISERAWHEGHVRNLGLHKELSIVRNCRGIGKKQMKLNDALPRMEIDPETYEVRADGVALTCEPATTLPLTQRYSLF
jgi:urease subunit alpha